MANTKRYFEYFDFYRTKMEFICRNSNEEFIKLSDYGITKHDVYKYEQLINQRREEAVERNAIYEHRGNFFKVLSVLLFIWIFFFIVGHLNDFMREYRVIFDILCYPVYIGLIWCAYKYAYPFLAFIIESTQEKFEEEYKYPNSGHPDGYDERIEKYFNDLLWKLREHQSV